MLLHYRIINKVGEGGMGQAYRAEDTKLGRYVALKLLAPDATRDQTAKRRLLGEAQSASVLNHPNIVTIYAIEEADGVDFIVMEFVEGETLTSARSREIVNFIAANVNDEKLRDNFLSAARSVL